MAFQPIYEHELSPSGRGRSELISPMQFQEFAAEGQKRLDKMASGKPSPVFGQEHGVYTPPQARHVWEDTKRRAYKATREDWGGGTYNPRTGRAVNFHEPDKHAVTVREHGQEQIAVAHNMAEDNFNRVMDQARRQYRGQLSRGQHYLGIFHDADTHQIEVDPVVVTGDPSGKHREEVGRLAARQIAAATHALGGAYHFQSGEGFWPPHTTEEG